MSAYNKVQPVGEGQQKSGERSEGNGEITSVSDPRRYTLHSFQLGSTSRPCKALVLYMLLCICTSLIVSFICLPELLNCLNVSSADNVSVSLLVKQLSLWSLEDIE